MPERMKRFLFIVAAYGAACFAAASTGSMIALAGGIAKNGLSGSLFSAILLLLFYGAPMTIPIAVSAAPFAFWAIAVAEVRGIRNYPYFALAGAFIPVAHHIFLEASPKLSMLSFTVTVPSGFLAGLTYWRIMRFAPERNTDGDQPPTARSKVFDKEGPL